MGAARLGWRLFRAACVAYVLTVTASFAYVWGIPWWKTHVENQRVA